MIAVAAHTADRRLEFDRFKRDINLTEFAAAYGYQRIRAKSSRASVAMAHPATDDKIIVTKSPNGHWIYCSVHDQADRGTIVDFVQHRRSRDMAEVLAELRSWLGGYRPEVAPSAYQADVATVVRDPALVEREFMAARTTDSSSFLARRGIRPATLASERFSGTWREDARGNVLFPHYAARSLTGFEKKNLGYTGFATGGAKSLWSSRAFAADRTLVVVEGAIDALSFHQVTQLPGARYLSTGGSLSRSQVALLASALRQAGPSTTMLVATDNDVGGDRLAAELEQLATDAGLASERAKSPVGKDWNDYVQHLEQDFIRSLGPQGIAR